MSGAWSGPPTVGAITAYNVVQTGNVAYPAGLAAGVPIFLAFAAGPPGQAQPTLGDTDFVAAVIRNTQVTTYLYWKIATGAEGASMTLDRGTSSGFAYAQMCTFTGGPTTVTGNVHAQAGTGSGPTTGLIYPSLTITQNGCLIITVAAKPFNASGVNVPAAYDAKISENHSSAGMLMVWEYAIQTAATNFASGAFTIGTDGSASRGGISAAFLPAAIAPTTSQACTNGIFVNP